MNAMFSRHRACRDDTSVLQSGESETGIQLHYRTAKISCPENKEFLEGRYSSTIFHGRMLWSMTDRTRSFKQALAKRTYWTTTLLNQSPVPMYSQRDISSFLGKSPVTPKTPDSIAHHSFRRLLLVLSLNSSQNLACWCQGALLVYPLLFYPIPHMMLGPALESRFLHASRPIGILRPSPTQGVRNAAAIHAG